MADFTEQLQEIKTHLSSSTKSHKPLAYSSLLHLQEQSNTNPSSIQSLADSCHSLLPLILSDIADQDEEIAAQALKCLGFLIYYPSIVVAIPGDDVKMIVEILEKVITSTKLKSVCNLGVWCISIQQFDASLLAAHFGSLLRAIVHALDNPVGSLSITFEAIQAVMKLATQLSEKMRDASYIWAPSIYRRLVSPDKREKDMSERCLLKLRSALQPPPLALSKAIAVDIKKKLLPAMKELLKGGMKIQTLQAWGWFIRILGPCAMKNRHLVNEMLKIPEQTFSDVNPQVQIASQVAWEGAIDALIHPSPQTPKTNTAMEHNSQQMRRSKGIDSENEADGLSKRIKLIMTPLIGIMSSKCDVSVHSSCLNTWCYLLHKLDTLIINPSVIKFVWEPILEVVFRVGPDSRHLFLWNFCLDLLDSLALARSECVSSDFNTQLNSQPSVQTSIMGPPFSGECSWKHHPVICLPWDLSQLEFFIKMIHILLRHRSMEMVTPETKSISCNDALRIFRSVLKGVQHVVKSSSITYNEIMSCLNTMLTFLKKVCEDSDSEDSGINDFCQTSLQFVEVATEELEPSILGSPLYKVAVDLQYIDNLESVNEFRPARSLGVCSTDMNMVPPILYLAKLYFCVVVKLTWKAPMTVCIPQGIHRYFRNLLRSFDPTEILYAFVSLLYRHSVTECLILWRIIADCLRDYIATIKNLSLLKTESDNSGYVAVCHFLCHPFAVYSCPKRQLTPMKTSGSLELSFVTSESQRKLELEHVIEVWKSLYISVSNASKFECSSSNSFSEDLSSMVNKCLDGKRSALESGTELEKDKDHCGLSFCGPIVLFVLEQILNSDVCCKGSRHGSDAIYSSFSGVKNSLGFTARFLRMSWTMAATHPPTDLQVTSRVFTILVRFVSCLYFKEDIVSFIEIVSSPLLQWLSYAEAQNENTGHQVQQLWLKILNSLQNSWPPINFNSSFLEHQAPLLEVTLGHPNPSISEPTMTFWNSTYGEQIKLDYPQNLLPVLDKLSRSGKVRLCKRGQQISGKGHENEDAIAASQGYKVTARLNRTFKRVELVEDTVDGFQKGEKPPSRPKRKGLELTEHQKEVRRAQQGRASDCDGHGPGIRTYTSVDFSQGNEESQESQEIRNAESILEMLKRDGKLS